MKIFLTLGWLSGQQTIKYLQGYLEEILNSRTLQASGLVGPANHNPEQAISAMVAKKRQNGKFGERGKGILTEGMRRCHMSIQGVGKEGVGIGYR